MKEKEIMYTQENDEKEGGVKKKRRNGMCLKQSERRRMKLKKGKRKNYKVCMKKGETLCVKRKNKVQKKGRE